jgi:hypothetical protein
MMKTQVKREFQVMDKSSEVLVDEQVNENDVDRLFAHLEWCEPPVDMVERIMAAVSLLPSPTVRKISPWQDLEILRIDEESIPVS